MSTAIAGASNNAMVTHYDCWKHLQSLVEQLGSVIKSNPKHKELNNVEDCDPAAQPLIWVTKWVDYSDKYGFGFQLIDGSWGVFFNDITKIVMLANHL